MSPLPRPDVVPFEEPPKARQRPLPEGGRLVSAQKAAAYLGVPYTSLRDWALRGVVPIVRVPGCRRLWFDRRDLDRLVDAWKERA